MGAEPLTIAEFISQAWVDHQSVTGGLPQVAAVVQGAHVRTQQQTVVQSVFTTGRQWTDVRRLQHGPDSVAGDRAPALVSAEHDSLKSLLANRCGARLGSPYTGPVR